MIEFRHFHNVQRQFGRVDEQIVRWEFDNLGQVVWAQLNVNADLIKLSFGFGRLAEDGSIVADGIDYKRIWPFAGVVHAQQQSFVGVCELFAVQFEEDRLVVDVIDFVHFLVVALEFVVEQEFGLVDDPEGRVQREMDTILIEDCVVAEIYDFPIWSGIKLN